MNKTGIVIIGQDEGEKLILCLESCLLLHLPIVYVDSGSKDSSVKEAQMRGAIIVKLDMSRPFTAARARNEGFKKLISSYPGIEFVQFIDGDCTLVKDWLPEALGKINSQDDIAIITGIQKELRLKASVYSSLFNMELKGFTGEIKYCAGSFLARVKAFKEVGGFIDSLVAGEEPELCIRMRKKGWKIYRINSMMSFHDSDINNFIVWWRRAVRSGYAYTEVSLMHKEFGVRELLSSIFWGILMPFIFIIGLILWNILSYLVILSYVLLITRIVGYRMFFLSDSFKDSFIYALSCIVAKYPQLQGAFKYYIYKLLKK